jgi:anionic glutamate receptor
VKQKERKKQELERQVFNADQFEEGCPPMSMVTALSSLEPLHACEQDPLMRRIDGSHMIPPSAVIHHRLPVKRQNKMMHWLTNFQFQAKKIDVFSRAFFPFLFFVFNVWYWSYYLTRSQGKSN